MSQSNKKVARDARLRWVPIAKMRVNPLAQRDLNKARVDKLAADFDLEQIGTPTVNERDGQYFIIDGQHRVEALKKMGWGDQQIQCWTYLDLTSEEEAELFLKLNDTLAVDAMSKFRNGVHAGREVECEIDRTVRAQGLVVSADQVPGAIAAVGTLRRVYGRGGPLVLGRSLRVIRDAYGDPGLTAHVIDGIALLCQRYNGQLDEQQAIDKLGKVRGGVNGLLGAAEKLRLSTGNQKAHCVAAAATEIINRGNRSQKTRLPDWWKADS